MSIGQHSLHQHQTVCKILSVDLTSPQCELVCCCDGLSPPLPHTIRSFQHLTQSYTKSYVCLNKFTEHCQ